VFTCSDYSREVGFSEVIGSTGKKRVINSANDPRYVRTKFDIDLLVYQ
jgi:hypothetical protein